MPDSLARLFIINALFTAAMMGFITIISPLVRSLGLSEWHGGVIVSLSGLCWVLTARRWGRWSDRRGRLPVLRWAAWGFTASFCMLALVADLLQLWAWPVWLSFCGILLFRALVGLNYGGVPTISAAWIADCSTPQQRTGMMARLGASNALGMVLGPPLLGTLAAYRLTMPLFAAAVLCVFACLLLFRLPAPKQELATSGSQLSWRDSRLRLPLLAGFLAMTAIVTAQMCIGFVALDRFGLKHGAAAAFTGQTLGMVGLALVLCQLLVSRLPGVAPRSWLMSGAGLASVGMLLAALSSVQGLFMLGYVLIAAGIGQVFPSMQAMTANAVAPNEQGAAAGTLGMAQGAATVVIPVLCMALYEWSSALPYLLAAAAMALLAGFAVGASTRKACASQAAG